jgi:predicted extracellular nuclease
MEDPITELEVTGWSDLIETYVGAEVYSYVFKGQTGYLDHALANQSMAGQILNTLVWYINADEPRVLDNNGFNQPDLNNPDEYRSYVYFLYT